MSEINFKKWLENRTSEICILCPNESQVTPLVEITSELGYDWSGGKNYNYYWDEYEQDTCYFFNPTTKNIEYCDGKYANKNGYTVYTLEDFYIPTCTTNKNKSKGEKHYE